MENPSLINNQHKTYLIGSMEKPAKVDDPRTWRDKISPKLNERGIYVFDPTKEETMKVGMPTSELMQKLQGWTQSGNWDLFLQHMDYIWRGKSIVKENDKTNEPELWHIMGDIDYVINSNFLIGHYVEGDQMGGTIGELFLAWYLNKPVYWLMETPRSQFFNKTIIYWILDSGGRQGQIFQKEHQLIEFLDEKYKFDIKKEKK